MNNSLSKTKLLKLFERCDAKILMNKDEYEILKKLPETFEIYRGVTNFKGSDIKVLSWTLDKDVAEWFALRYDESGKVYKAVINKKHVYAYFSRRDESEIIVDPDYLEDIHIEKDYDNSL